MRLLLRVVNSIILVLVLVALAGIYWFLWRPLPKTSGRLQAPVAQEVISRRDTLGVPHISAKNEGDLFFAQGYITAQERLWQMDGLRRYSAGDLAEIIGPAALDLDRESRRLRLRRIPEEAYTTLPEHDRAQLEAYTRGVNYYMETHQNALPFEFFVLQYNPRPWSVVDSILIGLHMFRTLTTSWTDEIEKRNLMNGGDTAKVNDLFQLRGGNEITPGGDVHPGSNAWVVGGSHTATGKPTVSNDMHLEYSIPGIWFLVHLTAPGLNVSGVALPGVPGVIVGHNDRIAWGLTNLGFDVQDLYIEKIDPRTGRYLFRGREEQARGEREIIRIRGRNPEEMVRWVTAHGPVFLDNGDEHLSLKWVAAQPGEIQFPFVDINKARTWEEFTKALARFPGPGQNFVFADIDGNIGYHAAGHLPIRRNYAGDLPADGVSGNFEWDGYIPFDQLPASYNPANGLIVSANQNPFPAGYAYRVNGNFAAPYRSRQIRDMLLAKRSGLGPEDSLRIQKDVYEGFAAYLARALVAASDKRKASNPDLADAIALLRSWNGQMDKDQAAPLIVALAFQYVRKAIANSASPGNGSLYNLQISSALVENLLRARPSGWFDDYDEILLRSLVDALEEGRRMQGTKVTKWQYGAYLRLEIDHAIGHRLPLVAKLFDIGPVPASGGSTTVKQTTRRIGPSERMNAELADWDHSLMNLPIGESGHVLSKHYKDQWDAYYNGTSFPMQFRNVDVKSTLRFEPLY